jgi:hypothetical protein
MVLVTDEPKAMLASNVRLAVVEAGEVAEPSVKSPPTLITLYFVEKSLVAFAPIEPPLILRSPGVALPPRALTPLATTKPSFNVKPPPYVFPAKAKIPGPFLTIPKVAEVEKGFVEKSMVLPEATNILDVCPANPIVPPVVVMVTFSLAVRYGKLTEAPVKLVLAMLNMACLPSAQFAEYGAALFVDQFAVFQAAVAPP